VNGSWTPERLMEAAGELCNGTLAEQDGAALDELLQRDPVARRIYIDHMWLHASLYAENSSYAGLHATEHMLDAVTTENPDSELALTRSHTWVNDPAAIPSRRRSWRPQMLAAALAGVAALLSWGVYEAATRGREDAGRQIAAADPKAEVAAQISGTHNCRWAQPELGIDYGSELRVGQRVELKEGLAEITFENGATVLLEGPATFVVDAADKLGLASGRLAAVVPQRSGGFRIHTQTIDVVESGAEFGLWAQESGAAEVHVFNGLVQANVRDAEGRTLRRLELNGAEAARISPTSTTVVEFPADDATFVRNIITTSGPHDGLLAYEGFRYPEGPLEAQNGGFGWAGPWFTTNADDEAGPDSNSVKPGSLTTAGMVPAGNRAMLAAQYNRIRRQLATSVGGVFDAAGLVENRDEVRVVGRDGKQVYISFLQRVSKTDDGFYGIEFHRGDGNGNRVLCIGNGADEAGYGATSNVNIYGKDNLPSLGAENTEVNFFVVKITFGVENRDVAEVYRNPESLRDEQVCKPDAVLRGNFAFDRISLANFDGAKIHEADEIRVGTHFLAVTGRWGSNQSRLTRQITATQASGNANQGSVEAHAPTDRFRWLLAAIR
jgi:HAMP domain-containing protein